MCTRHAIMCTRFCCNVYTLPVQCVHMKEEQIISAREFRANLRTNLDRAMKSTIYVRRGSTVFRIGVVPDKVKVAKPVEDPQTPLVDVPSLCVHKRERGECPFLQCVHNPNYNGS